MKETKDIAIRGRKWDSVVAITFEVDEGMSLEEIVLRSVKYAYVHYDYSEAQFKSLLRYARCRVNGEEKPREMWAHIYPKRGALIEIFHGVRGGGFGSVVQVVVGAVLAAVGYAMGWTGIGAAIGTIGVGMMLSGGLAMASNLLFPTANLSLGSLGSTGSESETYSPTYSISGAKNQANVNGYVPLIFGRHRHYPPLGGRSWTSWEGDRQFFHMLVIWGHPDIVVSDFKIGDTPLSSFKDVTHRFHQSTTGTGLKFFSNSYQEEQVEAVLTNAEGWNTRTVGIAESISLDFAFTKGLVDIDKKEGDYNDRTVCIQVQYREAGSGTWINFGSWASMEHAGATLTGPAQVYVYGNIRQGGGAGWSDPSVDLYEVAASGKNGGSFQIWPNRDKNVSGCDVSFGWSGNKVTVTVTSGSYERRSVRGGTITLDPPNMTIYTNKDGSVTMGEGNAQRVYPTQSGYADLDFTITAYDGRNITVRVLPGYTQGTGNYCFTAHSAERVVRSIRMDGLVEGVYEVQCRRTTEDSSSNYIRDECTWLTMRAITNVPAFKTPVPLCCSELRIRAGEQLSGYVETFNAICEANIPDWNGSSWTVRKTRNPASAMRYALTSRHCLSTPYSTNKLDDAKLREFWQYCNSNGYEFNFICDSEQSLWERLVQITAPGRGAPTTDVDGKWGVVIDRNGKTPVQMFTPRNSWGLSVQRDYARLPDALRVSFVDQDDGYSTKEGFIYNDGFSADGFGGTKIPQDVVEWEFPGITKWDKVYTQGRMHLARLLHRQFAVTLNTDWEWIVCHRGDLVGVSSDVLMNVFGSARINGLLYNIDGVPTIIALEEKKPVGMVPIGIRIDDTVLFNEPAPARYGVAIRYNTGKLSTFEIEPEYDEERDILRFVNTINSSQIPPIGALISVSLLGEEYDEYLVAQITPQEDAKAQLLLIPYKIKEIEAAISGPIPDYEENVILDVVRGRELPAPTITQVRSDEIYLEFINGMLSPRIAVWWKMPKMNRDPTTLSYQAKAVLVEEDILDEEEQNPLWGIASGKEPYVSISGAVEERVYNIYIRAIDPITGVASPWSKPVQHMVVGRTAKPPTPQNIKITPSPPDGLLISWDPVDVFDLSYYEVRGPGGFLQTTKQTFVIMPPYGLTGVLTFTVYAVDVLNIYSDPGQASYTVQAPAAPVIKDALLMDDGVEMSWTDATTTWPIDIYIMQYQDRQGTSLKTSGICPVPTKVQRGDTVSVRGRDIFRNYGDWSDPFVFRIIPPATPELTLTVSPNGNVLVVWQDCKTTTTIAKYIVEGAVSCVVSGLSVEIMVKDILWTEVEELGVRYRIGAITVYVTAEDKYGFQGGRGGQTYIMYPPYNPVLRMEVQSDGLYLKWQDCTSTFTIDRYEVYDEYYNEMYMIDGTSQLLRPRPAGTYNFYVQAFDVIGNYSSRMMLANYIINGVGVVKATAVLDGADVLLTWNPPGSTFPIDYYDIYDMSGKSMGKAKVTYFRFPAPVAGSYEYSIVGRDVAGNIGTEGVRAAITINMPLAPKVSASLAGEGIMLTWEPGKGENRLPVVAWDVVRQWEVSLGGNIVDTKEEDYGRLDVDTLTVPAVTTGSHTFMVRAIDSAGDIGPWGYVDFDVQAPGKVTFVNCVTIDNNVMLYWTEPDFIFFPIAYYLFEEIDSDGYAMEIGRIDALFSSSFESVSGQYTYAITPVDVAGNLGGRSTISMQVAQPPDFILYHDYDSLFNGTKVNFVLDGQGHMIGPFPDDTWQQNLDRIASLHNVKSADITWQQKINYGYTYFMDPPAASGTYTEIVDVGTLIPSTKITVTITSRVLSGSPKFTCKIEVSQDKQTWTLISDNATTVFATEFRYVRYTITYTGGTVSISNINYNLNVKRQSDFGRVTSKSTDNGEGYVNDSQTPMLKGTWVPFNVSFTDVESLPKPNVVNNENYTAFTIFVDVLRPQGFRVFVLDKNGQRVTATVDWVAYGV